MFSNCWVQLEINTELVALSESRRAPVCWPALCQVWSHTPVSFAAACWEHECRVSRGDCGNEKDSRWGLCVLCLSKPLWSAALHFFKVLACAMDAKLATPGLACSLKIYGEKEMKRHRWRRQTETGMKGLMEEDHMQVPLLAVGQ